MDHSTTNVTLLAGFVFDVLREYQHMRRVCGPAFEMAKHLDPGKPEELCSIDLYNDVCTWIEQNIGEASIRKAGIAIGERAYNNIIAQDKMKDPTPLGILEALKWAASTMIQDPKGRGWTIVSHDAHSVMMRRTQTFNCILQEGLLLSLVERTEVQGADIEHVRCVRNGDEFCDYRITWM
jgi:hypothetical protein